MALSKIEEVIADYRAGKLVIIVDDEERENEGDFAVAAEKVSPEVINFMATHGRGLICVSLTGERLDKLKIPMMVGDRENSSPFGTAFTVSVEAKHSTTTGISAHDRAVTVKALIDPQTRPEDIARPGHMFPLRARDGGVLVRAGQTEASLDLARLAGLDPGAVICEIMNEDGTMARLPQLTELAARHGIRIVSVAQIIAHRRQHEKLVRRLAQAALPTPYGEFTAIAYESMIGGEQHVALVMGDVTTPEPVLTRIHSECMTGDVFGSMRCDCGEQLRRAMQVISAQGRGAILYLRQEGRGIGLHNKLKAYQLQDGGLDTVEANISLGFSPDLRDYGIGAQILVDLGMQEIRLLTNNPRKVIGLDGYGLAVVERLPLVIEPNPANSRYLMTKREKLGHIL